MKPSAIVTTYEQRLRLHSEAYVKMNNKNKNLTSLWNHSAPQLPSLGIWNLCPGRQRSRADIHPVSHVGKSTCQHGRRGRGRTDGGERQEDSRRGGMIIEGREREREGGREGEREGGREGGSGRSCGHMKAGWKVKSLQKWKRRDGEEGGGQYGQWVSINGPVSNLPPAGCN